MAKDNDVSGLSRKIEDLIEKVKKIDERIDGLAKDAAKEKKEGIADFGKKIDALTKTVGTLEKKLEAVSGKSGGRDREDGRAKEQKDLVNEIIKGIGQVVAGPFAALMTATKINDEKIVERGSELMAKMEDVTRQLDQLEPKINEAKQAFQMLDFQNIANQLNTTARTLHTLNLAATALKVNGLAKETMNWYSHLIDKLQRADAAIDEAVETFKRFPDQLKKDVQGKFDAAVKELVAFFAAIKQKIDAAISGLLNLVAALVAVINRAISALNVVQRAKDTFRRLNPFG